MRSADPSGHFRLIVAGLRSSCRVAAAAALAAGLMLAYDTAEAQPTARSSSVVVQDAVPTERPEFPVPSDPNLLFYIQRSINSNTVVYAANFRADGTLDPSQPVLAFWRRFNDAGERKALGFFENRVAFGVRSRGTETPGVYEVRLVALPGRRGTLRQTGEGEAELTFPMGRYTARPVYAYVEVDESGMLPKVVRIRLHGIDTASGKAITETIEVSGGEIRE